MKTITVLLATLLVTPFLGFISTNVHAADRHIHVNDQHLEAADIELFDAVTGYIIPDGNYWINMETGAWGVEGSSEAWGHIAQLAGTESQPVAQESVIQERVNVSQNGTYVSGQVDGRNCQYVSAGEYSFRSCD